MVNQLEMVGFPLPGEFIREDSRIFGEPEGRSLAVQAGQCASMASTQGPHPGLAGASRRLWQEDPIAVGVRNNQQWLVNHVVGVSSPTFTPRTNPYVTAWLVTSRYP